MLGYQVSFSGDDSLRQEVRESASTVVEPKHGTAPVLGISKFPAYPPYWDFPAHLVLVRFSFHLGCLLLLGWGLENAGCRSLSSFEWKVIKHLVIPPALASLTSSPFFSTFQSSLIVPCVISRVNSYTPQGGASKSWHITVSSFDISNIKWKAIVLHCRDVIMYFQ